ncbi:uncharacterized protein TrAtP1_010942 [Trichoderma atroviride]|uniref:uncharacterized protein n=1 Tax=Hypocrea atroviridis TaxID=63577 RepID=UPI00331A5476|nr:hypothetical protein TrAtP1_010942 [Trichoderma atroviride]
MHPMIASAHAARKPQPTTTSTPEQFSDRRCRHRRQAQHQITVRSIFQNLLSWGFCGGQSRQRSCPSLVCSRLCVLDTTSWLRLAGLVPLRAGHAGTPTRP